MPYIYNTYTEYLYDVAMTLWYAGATYQPNDQELVDMSAVVYQRSIKAASHEHVMHPDEGVSLLTYPEEQWYREYEYEYDF